MDRADLEGYLIGVERRVRERRAEGHDDPSWDGSLAQARTAIRQGALAEADRRLRDLDRALDAFRTEVELQDRPRGLVGYVPKGDRGVPPSDEEEPLSNRIRLIGRLASLRAAHGEDVTEVRRLLADARRAYEAGDRAAARRAVDDAHRRLEGEAAAGGGHERS